MCEPLAGPFKYGRLSDMLLILQGFLHQFTHNGYCHSCSYTYLNLLFEYHQHGSEFFSYLLYGFGSV